MSKIGFEALAKQLEQTDVADAAKVLALMMGAGNGLTPGDPKTREYAGAMMDMAKIGVMAVIHKRELLLVLRDAAADAAANDDTTLEDEQILGGA